MIRAGIIGGAGYTAGELIRLLLLHPSVQLQFVASESHARQPVTKAHPDLTGETILRFESPDARPDDLDVMFLCSGHGRSRETLEKIGLRREMNIIDLSSDFRVLLPEDAPIDNRQFVYGLPETSREEIRKADSVANPGCFATLIQLSLLPLASSGMLSNDVHVHAITGSTGAGASTSSTTHFTWRSGNVSVYKPFEHRHLAEINRTLRTVQPEFVGEIHFIPIRGNFTRGIFGTAYTSVDASEDDVRAIYRDHYAGHPFTIMVEGAPDLKRVVNTNKCLLHVGVHGDRVLVTGALDNLLKGASGQAVQNMNLMFGLDETTGLHLKASAF